MEATTAPAVTKLQVLEDALKHARGYELRAVRDGVAFWEDADGNELNQHEPENAAKVCNVCYFGACTYAALKHGLSAAQVEHELGITLGDFSGICYEAYGTGIVGSLEQHGDKALVHVLQVAVDRQRAAVGAGG